MDAMNPREREQALVKRAQHGDRAAFGDLVKLHQDGIYGLALRFTGNPDQARDLAQEAFIQIFRSLHAFRGQSKFKTWAYVIVRNLCYAHSKSEGRELAILDGSDERGSWRDSLEMPDGDPAIALLTKDTHQGVQEAMMELSPKYRLVISLHHFQELRYEEMAEILSLPLGTVKTHLFRAKAALKVILERRGLV